MSRCFGLISFMVLATAAPAAGQTASSPAAADPLWGEVDVRWEDRPPLALMRSLAKEAGIPIWIDESLAARLDRTSISFSGPPMRRLEALSWAARLAGVRCVALTDRLAVVPPEDVPALWEIQDRRRRSGSESPLLGRTASLELTDVSVSRFAEALQDSYRLPVRVEPVMLYRQELLSFEGAVRPLSEVLRGAAIQLNSGVFLEDGVVVIQDRPKTAEAAANVRENPLLSRRSSSYPEDSAGGISSIVQINDGAMSWGDLGRELSERGVPVSIPDALAPRRLDGFDVEGAADAVLAALVLSENGDWTLRRSGEAWKINNAELQAAVPAPDAINPAPREPPRGM